MKTVIILVLSTDMSDVQGTGPMHHYRTLTETSLSTWDSVEVSGVETIFYHGRCLGKSNSYKMLYTDAEDEGLFNMGRKELAAFEYALANRQFDFVFLANSSLYVDKIGLRNYVQDKPTEGLAMGLAGQTVDKPLPFLWGPARLLSRDVVERVVLHKDKWDHVQMEDVALSYVLHEIGVELNSNLAFASIASWKKVRGNLYEVTCYNEGDGFKSDTLRTLESCCPKQFAFRVKDDNDRTRDVFLMKRLKEAFDVRYRINQESV